MIAVVLVSVSGYSQSQAEKDKIKELEVQRQMDRTRKVTVKIDSAVRLSEEGHYEEADKKFIAILKSIRSVPSDLTFHFGRNSFLLGKYKQSVDWLNKYIQLKGTQGQYSEQAMEWLSKAETELLKEREKEAQRAAEILSRDFEIDCGPTGKVMCPTCKGSTVVVKKNYFGEVYKTCPSCSKRGYLTCPEYNKLLKGQLIHEAD
jgi:tetratricopeptide (TPR) repeat protein